MSTRFEEPVRTMIYVVDDEPTVGELIATLLEIERLPAQVFQNPLTALQSFIAAAPRPTLLITDYLMTGLNGMELIHHCKELSPDLKTILISGNVGADVVQRFRTRPNQFIRKPFQSKVLVGAVRELVGV
jgi:DNA-binding NtrC family response regulator